MPCCLQEMEITARGITIGWILQKADFCNPVFQVCDADKQVVLEIKGPICAFSCCCSDVKFEVLICCTVFSDEYEFNLSSNDLCWLKVLTVNGEKVGKITKQWSGLAREAFTDSDNFGINFPMDLDVRCKATLLAAVFLIVSFFYYQNYWLPALSINSLGFYVLREQQKRRLNLRRKRAEWLSW